MNKMNREEFLKQSEVELDKIIKGLEKLKGKPIKYLTLHVQTYDQPGEKGNTTLALMGSGDSHPAIAAFQASVIAMHTEHDTVGLKKLMEFIQESASAVKPSKEGLRKINTVLDELLELLEDVEEPKNDDADCETKDCKCGHSSKLFH